MRRYCLAFSCWLTVAAAQLPLTTIAADFVPPPQGEREAVQALSQKGARISVDADYRVTMLMLGPEISNEDLKWLSACDKLESLQIQSPKVTNDGVESLKKIKQLANLTVMASSIDSDGMLALRMAMPRCSISFPRERNLTTSANQRITRSSTGDRASSPGDRASSPGDRAGFSPAIARSDRPATSQLFSAASRGALNLVRNPSIQDELKLSSEQRQQMESLASPATLNRILEEKIAESLTAEQRVRLHQLELQNLGVAAFDREEVISALNLTNDQLNEIRKIKEETQAGLVESTNELRRQGDSGIAGIRERLEELAREREVKSQAVLTEEQRQTWEQLLGPKGTAITARTVPTAPPAVGSFKSVADLSQSLFLRYDIDQDGQLTEAEFPESNRTRQSMLRAGIEIKLPIKAEDFAKSYTKYVDAIRPRQ